MEHFITLAHYSLRDLTHCKVSGLLNVRRKCPLTLLPSMWFSYGREICCGLKRKLANLSVEREIYCRNYLLIDNPCKYLLSSVSLTLRSASYQTENRRFRVCGFHYRVIQCLLNRLLIRKATLLPAKHAKRADFNALTQEMQSFGCS